MIDVDERRRHGRGRRSPNARRVRHVLEDAAGSQPEKLDPALPQEEQIRIVVVIVVACYGARCPCLTCGYGRTSRRVCEPARVVGKEPLPRGRTASRESVQISVPVEIGQDDTTGG